MIPQRTVSFRHCEHRGAARRQRQASSGRHWPEHALCLEPRRRRTEPGGRGESWGRGGAGPPAYLWVHGECCGHASPPRKGPWPLLSSAGRIPSKITAHLSGKTFSQVCFTFGLLEGDFVRGFAISLFSEARFPFAEKCDVVKTQEQTDSHTLLFCLSPFLFILSFATHKSLALDSLVPVSVSRTFAFSRGDSLAGSPGKHAWVCRVSVKSVGCPRGLWSLSLS